MEAGILYPDTPTLNQLFNLLKENHPALAVIDKDVVQILKNTALTLDKLNPLRNSASLAHSNPILLKADEAMFVINSANSILAYLNTKFNK